MVGTMGTGRRRRVVRGAGAAAAAIGLSVGLVACGGGGEWAVRVETGDPSGTPSAILASASEATTAVESGRVRITYAIGGSGDGESFEATMAGRGSFADFGRQAELTITMTGASATGQSEVPGSFVMRQIVDGPTAYVKIESDQTGIPGFGDGWMKVDTAELGQGDVQSPGYGGLGSDWTGFVDSLKGAGATVVETGTDTVDGTPVTVYEGSIDPDAAVAQSSPDQAADVQAALDQLGGSFEMPFTAWVDADGLVRRLELRVSADMGVASMDMTVTIELYDLGAPITITPPPADEVSDFGGLSSLLLGGGGMGTA